MNPFADWIYGTLTGRMIVTNFNDHLPSPTTQRRRSPRTKAPHHPAYEPIKLIIVCGTATAARAWYRERGISGSSVVIVSNLLDVAKIKAHRHAAMVTFIDPPIQPPSLKREIELFVQSLEIPVF